MYYLLLVNFDVCKGTSVNNKIEIIRVMVNILKPSRKI